MTWQSVGTHSFVPTDKAVQVGSFDLAAGQDTIWVKITQLNSPGDWPWSYGILSWRNANGTPLGSIKAYSNRLGEVFRLGNGLPPSDGVGSIWFEPRGFNLGWLKAGFPWELQFEAQAGASDLTTGYWNRDPQSGVITPKTSGDNLDMSPGWIKASSLILTNGGGGGPDRTVPGYQEGTWTPTVSQGGITEVSAAFWRIGNAVTLNFRIAKLTSRVSDPIRVSGLPYSPVDSGAGYTGAGMINQLQGRRYIAYLETPSNRIEFFASADTNVASWSPAYYNNLGDQNDFRFQLTYLTSDSNWVPA